MIQVTVQKNLIAMEDLLFGFGTTTQHRGPTGVADVTVTKINAAIFPYDADHTFKEIIDLLQTEIDNLPVIVDQDGNLLVGYIDSSAFDLSATHAHRIWRKDINANLAQIYYGDELILQYDPSVGDIIVPDAANYIAADAIVTAAFQAADDAINTSIADLIASLGSAAYLDAGTGANQVLQIGSDGKLPAIDGSNLTGLSGGVPIGTVIWVGYNDDEVGYLEANGAAISRTTYAALFAKYGTKFGAGNGSTTFNLPQLQGEFVRTWDNGRGIDAGRTLGSSQSEAFKTHTHAAGTLAAASAGSHTHSGGSANTFDNNGDFDLPGTHNKLALTPGSSSTPLSITTNAAGDHSHSLSGNTASAGALETRPRNIALKALVKVA